VPIGSVDTEDVQFSRVATYVSFVVVVSMLILPVVLSFKREDSIFDFESADATFSMDDEIIEEDIIR